MKKQQYPIIPKKSFGQNFLINAEILKKIVHIINPIPLQKIVEVGPGTGVLTEKLVQSGASITAVELDRDMITILEQKFLCHENFRLIHQDVLWYKPNDSIDMLVGNIPYNLTTKLFEKILLWEYRPQKIVFLIQKEVGEKIIQKNGKNSPLALCIAMLGVPRIALGVPPSAFYPPPNVDSVVLEIDCTKKIKGDLGSSQDQYALFDFAHKLFRMPRKTLLNNFSSLVERILAEEILMKAKIDTKRRPETLQIEEIQQIMSIYKSIKSGII